MSLGTSFISFVLIAVNEKLIKCSSVKKSHSIKQSLFVKGSLLLIEFPD